MASNVHLLRQKSLSNQAPMSLGSALGYESIRLGKPFSALLDLPEFAQRNYERNRLRAISMVTEGISLPPVTPTGCPPKKLVDYIKNNPGLVPTNKHQAEDPDLQFTLSPLDRRGFPRPIPTYRVR